jgi:hypothetical protein
MGGRAALPIGGALGPRGRVLFGEYPVVLPGGAETGGPPEGPGGGPPYPV